VLGVLLAVFRYALFLVGSKKYPDLERSSWTWSIT
jgi:hypothetical protein